QMFPKKDDSGPLTFNVTGNLMWGDSDTDTKSVEARKNWSAIIGTCDRINRKTRELSLVTIDALMVRWAILASHGELIDKLLEAEDKSESDSKYAKALSKVETLLKPKIGDKKGSICWSRADENMLRLIEGAAKTKFERE